LRINRDDNKKAAIRDLDIYNAIKTTDFFDSDFDSAQTTHWVMNVVRIPDDNFEQLILDYKYRFHTGERAPTFFYTIAFLVSEKTSLPNFALYPHAEAPESAGKGIAFDSHPDFAKNYNLSAENEGDVRRLFSDQIVVFLVENDRFILLCNNNTLRVELSNSEWKSKAIRGSRVKIQYISEYIDTTEMLFSLFRENLK
jgi:hypothetical protein